MNNTKDTNTALNIMNYIMVISSHIDAHAVRFLFATEARQLPGALTSTFPGEYEIALAAIRALVDSGKVVVWKNSNGRYFIREAGLAWTRLSFTGRTIVLTPEQVGVVETTLDEALANDRQTKKDKRELVVLPRDR